MTTLDPAKLVTGLVGAVETTVGVPPFLRFILDNFVFTTVINQWLFPSKPVDLWATFKDKVEKLIEYKVEYAVGEATFKRVASELKGLATAFADYANVSGTEEREMRLAALVTQCDVVVAGIESVPPRYLPLVADTLLVIAVAHLAALLDAVQRHPERYENQIALNETAIRYSDFAAAQRDRFLWYRLAQIAEGVGLVYATEERQSSINGDQKRVTFFAYDDFIGWQNGSGAVRFICTPMFQTGWLPVEGMTQEYYDTQQKAQDAIGKYADAAKQEVYTWWNDHLCTHTQAFMNLVDWTGRNANRQPRDRLLVRAYPRVQSVADGATLLQRVDLFLAQQMDQFVASGPRYAQTYRIPGDQRFGGTGTMLLRADTYDTSVAAIYLLARGDLRRAGDLVDGLCSAVEHDPIGGGRIVAATRADGLIDPSECYSTSIFGYDGATRDVGNACWAGLAMTRLYAKTGNYRYLHNAMAIGRWIVGSCTVGDPWQGFSGGEDAWAVKRLWRSVEHNVDAFALFNNLFALTGDAAWQDAASRARTLVLACRATDGFYFTGTGETQVLNTGVIPADTQTWTSLAGVDPAGNATALQYLLNHFVETTTDGFKGVRFALAGSGVQNEVTAGAAMALLLQGGAYADVGGSLLASLTSQQTTAPGADGLGIVATPGTEADTGPGLGWKYYNWPHVASTAWTGLAALVVGDPSVNPYATVTQPAAK
jgi:hypothetical protein